MALFNGTREIGSIYFKNRVISAIYKGTRLIWEALKSCFSAGFWVNEKPWVNDEGWRNND